MTPSPPPRRVIRDESPSDEPAAAPVEESAAIGRVAPAPDPPKAPPPVGSPLPGLPAALGYRAPPIAPAYRSTVELPPPPLLDAGSPSPYPVPAASRGPLLRRDAAGAWPGTYAVRDGDDLTAIAIRFYGSPAAAEAIWSANRDRLPDPQVLPIGLELRLPPPAWSGVPSGGRQRMIEPL